MMEEVSPSPNEPKPAFFCHLCGISCLSAFNLQSHFLGIKHRKAEEALRRKAEDLEPTTPFFCHLCGISCASALNLQSHFLGGKHRKAEEALRGNPEEPEEEEEEEGEEAAMAIEVKPSATLEEHINACKGSEPALGLEYIDQAVNRRGFNKYKCKLCEFQSGLTHMFMHIIGAKHRTFYLAKHHPSLGISDSYVPAKSKRIKKLKDICIQVEKEFGRQKINTVDISEFFQPPKDASSTFYAPDSEEEEMDFTNDDFVDADKPAASKSAVTFLELKAIHEAKLRKAAFRGNLIACSEEAKQDKDTENPVTGPAGEPQESSSSITNHQSLLEFLECFRVLEDGDVKFVISVVEKLSLALLRHKKVSEESKSLVSKSDATNNDGGSKTQNSAAPPSPHAKQDPKPPNKDKLSSVSKLSKTEINLVTSSESTPGAPQGAERQPQKMGIPECSKTGAIGERKKLQFTVSSSKKAQALRDPVGAAPQASRGAPPAPTRFPSPHAAGPPRVAPPLFPIAKDDALTEFFNSIKNMEVPEVISTLNAITATNPALKGIHVPSLVRYLGQTGKLKPTLTMQQPNP